MGWVLLLRDYYLVLCDQVGPQIEIKYKQGGKQFIHRASHRWTKFSGDNAHCTCTVHKLCLFWKVLAGTSTSCSHTPSSSETLYPGALKLVSGGQLSPSPTSPRRSDNGVDPAHLGGHAPGVPQQRRGEDRAARDQRNRSVSVLIKYTARCPLFFILNPVQWTL